MQEELYEFAEHWYRLPTKVEQLMGLELIRAGRNIAKPNYHVGPRLLEHFSIHFVLSGAVALNDDIIVHGGDIFCMFPDQTYSYRISHENSTAQENIERSTHLQMFWIALSGSRVEPILQTLGLTKYHCVMRNCINSTIEEILHQISSVLETSVLTDDKHFSEGFIISELLNSLLYNLSRDLPSLDTKSDWDFRIIEYIHKHYSEGISVNDLAEYLKLSRSHFIRTFTQRFGKSPYQYIQSVRMERAKELLVMTDYSVTEIALSIGFSDIYTFSKSFTHYFNVPPTQYRNLSK